MLPFRSFLFFLLMHTAFFLFAQSPARSGKDYAFFFYVTSFQDRGWPRLPETAEEAAALKKELEDNYGFVVELIPNPKKQQILSKITEINARPYSADDQVLFFFSMHGHFDQAANRGYLVPADGLIPQDDPYGQSWISYDDLGSYITKNDAEHVLLALDACYSGAFGDRYKGRPEQTPWQETGDCAEQARRALANDSRLYFTSGSRDQRTPAESLFAKRWLEALRRGAETGIVRSNDLRYYLGTIEKPAPEGGSFTGKHQGGDFIFVHKTACTAPAAAFNAAEESLWQQALQAGTKEAYTFYLQLYPAGKYSREANEKIAALSARPDNTTIPSTSPDNMVFVSGGDFQMGSNDGASDEKPVRQVTVDNFYMGAFEVSNVEFVEFLNAVSLRVSGEEVSLDGNLIYDLVCSGCSDWEERILHSGGRFSVRSGYEKHPVVLVTWYGAAAYCNWLSRRHGYRPVYTINGTTVTADWNADGYRLPTEAEWEFAARSRGGTEKWAGVSDETNLADYANFNDSGAKDGFRATAPTGSFKPNDLGLYDMSGNVWDWCWDWYDNYPTTAQTNPRGPTSGSNRVVRGGSWGDVPAVLRCTYRHRGDPAGRNFYVGFRLSRAAR